MKSPLIKTAAILIFFTLTFFSFGFSQNLIVNPSAESGDPTSNGWTSVSIGTTGSGCYNSSGWRIIQTLNSFPNAQSGSYFFFAGCSSTTGATFELKQDINVSLNASLIDAGGNAFTFSGYLQTYAQTPADQAEIIVEYRNAANTTVLTSYSTGFQTSASTWKNFSNTTVAPVGTRIIRIRLLSKVNTGPSIDGYFDNLSLTSSIPLPVSFISIDAKALDNSVQVNWVTASESDNSFFTVQRSQNQTDWKDIAVVDGKINSNTNVSYSVSDNDPPEGLIFYRVKQTDMDGKSTYSETVQTRFSAGSNDIKIFPNPAKNIFTIEGANLKNAQITMCNGVGQTIIPAVSIQQNNATFNISGLASGIYYIRIQNNNNISVKKLVIN